VWCVACVDLRDTTHDTAPHKLRSGAVVARYSTTQIAEWGWARGGEADCTCGVGPLAGWGWLRGGTDCRMWGRLRCGGGCGVGTSIVWCVACVALRDTT